MPKIRLGFHYHVPAVLKNGYIYLPGYLGRFIDSLAVSCEQVVCFFHSPRSEEISHMDYQILSNNVRLVDIGLHSSVIDRTIKSKIYTSFLRRHASEIDVLLVRGPSPLLPAMVSASPVPTALLLVGDYMAGVNDLPQPRWRKELSRLWSYWNKWGQERVARHSLTFVNSRVLYDELYGKALYLHETRTTTLTANDFFIRSDTCQSVPYRLLYVGRMDRTKGLLQMVEALALLTERGENLTLDLVGWQVPGDPVLGEIDVLSHARGVGERVHYLGARPLGPELFDCYKQADIFVIASLLEGFPRVIWEAMAHSLPVVATRVGSIPAFIDDAAELVQPGDAVALANAIAHLTHQPETRRQIIQRGLELARGNTLETQVGAMVATMQAWLEARY